MALKLTNNATSRLATSLSNSATTVVLSSGDGAKFPSLSVGDWFPLTVLRADNTREIMYATARSGDVLTVTRAQEGTAAMAFEANDRAELRASAGVFASYLPINGGIINGDVRINGEFYSYHAANPGTGAVFLTSTGSRFLSTDGSSYYLPSGDLYVNNGKVWTASTFNPATKMDVAGGSFTGPVWSGKVNGLMAQSDQSCSMVMANNSGLSDSGMAMLGFYCNAKWGIKLGLRDDGYFGLGGWSSATWRWYVSAADGSMVAAGNVTAYSDPRLKDDVSRIDAAMDIIEQLDGVRFTWNNKTKLIGSPGKRDIGVLADQVEAVLPEIVGLSVPDEDNGGERWRVVAYDKLIPVLIEAVKELSGRVKKLEGR